MFGEIAFFDGEPRSATIRALGDGSALRITRDRFDNLSGWNPVLARQILIDLGKEAIDWWMPQARPHTTQQWEELLDDLDLIRELVRMIERIADSVSAEN